MRRETRQKFEWRQISRLLAVGVAITAGIGSLIACQHGGNPASAIASTVVPASTPPGITTIDVVRDQTGAQPEFLWTRLGDSVGKTILTYESDKPLACSGKCAEIFRPVLAQTNAVAFGDWSLVVTSDGAKQWAYQGSPLFTDALEVDPGQIVNDQTCIQAQKEDATNTIHCEVSKSEPPPAEWKVARYQPEKSTPMPPRVTAKRIPEAMGSVLVNERGRTLYVAATGPAVHDASLSEWIAFQAPSIGQPVGEFTAIDQADGTRQWAYKGHPLYTYVGDNDAGDINGMQQPGWTVAYLSRDFLPAQVMLKEIAGRGMVLANSEGAALYTRHAFDFRWGGRNLYHGFRSNYLRGKALGVDGCSGPCLAEWKPLLAPEGAVASGYWEVVGRPDGTQQWAYGGFALYSFTKDIGPGVILGSNQYEYVAGTRENRYAKLTAVTDPRAPAAPFGAGGAGLYWHVEQP